MTHTTEHTTTAARWHALAAALPLLACSAAWSEGNPYTIGASETVTHDSNVVRLPDGTSRPASLNAVTDWIATTALFAAIDQPIGRQRLFGNLSVRDNHYRYNGDYSNLAYGLAGGLDWSTIERVSGTVSLSSNRSLASFDQGRGQNAPDIVKNIEQTDQYGATVRVGVVTDLTMEGGFNHQSQRFSEVGDRLDQNSVNLGLRYRIGGELALGGGLRFTNGRYPDNDDSFKARNLDLSADWTPSPISTVSARLSVGKNDHSAANAQDYSGETGSLAWNWKPTGKLAFTTQLSRVTGNDSSFVTVVGPSTAVTAQADNSRLTTTAGLNVTYEATAKILVDAGYSRIARKLTRTPSQISAALAADTDSDRLTRMRLGVRYLPTRTLEFDCSVERESRSAELSILSYSYHANTVACAAQFSVQP
jgi:hypothetical protein